ncbi:hypothetical protein ABIE18_003516 [Arthrobacter sp. 2762]
MLIATLGRLVYPVAIVRETRAQRSIRPWNARTVLMVFIDTASGKLARPPTSTQPSISERAGSIVLFAVMQLSRTWGSPVVGRFRQWLLRECQTAMDSAKTVVQ